MKSISVDLYEKNQCNSYFRKINFVKMASKRKKPSHKNTADFSVMNVGNSPQISIIWIDYFIFFPEMLKARPDRS